MNNNLRGNTIKGVSALLLFKSDNQLRAKRKEEKNKKTADWVSGFSIHAVNIALTRLYRRGVINVGTVLFSYIVKIRSTIRTTGSETIRALE